MTLIDVYAIIYIEIKKSRTQKEVRDMTKLELRILNELQNHVEQLRKFDKTCEDIANKYFRKAEIQTVKYWKEDYERTARFHLGHKMHEYDFLTEWKNVIAKAMYNKTYQEWHSAEAGRYAGTGHGAYITTELTEQELKNIDIVFDNMVDLGYFKISKSGKMAKLNK